MQNVYGARRAFVRNRRRLTAGKDLVFIHQAVLQRQDWLGKNPNDRVVGAALEAFDILEEAAQIGEQKQQGELLVRA